jgi:hypothetical protein
MDIVGELHYSGDIRDKFGRQVIYTERYGLIINAAASYDRLTNLTTVYYAQVQPGGYA